MSERIEPIAEAIEHDIQLLAVGDVSAPDAFDVLISLMHNKKKILQITGALTAAIVIILLLVPNTYRATTTIAPPQQTQSAATLMLSQLAGSNSLASVAGMAMKNPNDIYIGMLKSRTVQDALISKFDLQRVYRDKRMSDTRADLNNASSITWDKEGLLRIDVEDHDARRAAEMANQYVVELKKLTQQLAVSEASQRRLFFEQQVEQAKQDLNKAEIAMKESQQRSGMLELDAQSRAVLDAVGTVHAQIAAKEVQLQATRSFATNRNPQVLLLEQELSGLRAQASKLERQQSAREGDPLVSTSQLPAAALDYIRNLREVKYRESVFELLTNQYEAARLDEVKNAAVIQVVDVAVPPDKKSSPRRALLSLLAFVIVFAGCCCYFIVREAIANAPLGAARREQIANIRAGWRRW